MAGKTRSVIATAVIAAACAAGGWICCGMLRDRRPAQRPAKAAVAEQTVAVRRVEMRRYNLPERYVAHAEAVQEVELLPQVDGYVREIAFKEGDFVKEGQLLYVLDDERYQAVANQRRADLAAAEAEQRRASRYFERMQSADERGITQLERDNAEAAAESSNAAVLQKKADLVVAEYDLKKTKVYAPIAGQIGKTMAHVGDYVAPSKGALAHIMQVDPIRVSFPVTDRFFVKWREAQYGEAFGKEYRARLLLPDGSMYAGEGVMDFDDNQMNRKTATITVRMSFPNPKRLLVPNGYLTLLIDRRNPEAVPCVPQQAVFDRTDGSKAVFVVRDDATAEQRTVTVKRAFEGWMPVLSGLKDGESVVVSGVSKLREGAKVRIVEATGNLDLDPDYRTPVKE